MKAFVKVDEKDNVATLIKDAKKGECLAGISLLEDIASGHKFALKNIKKGELIIKYKEAIAKASKDIAKGSWVHIHNTEGIRGRGDRND